MKKFFIDAFLLTLLALLLFVLLPHSPGAPRPIAKPAPVTTTAKLTPPDLHGKWSLKWGDSDWDMTLSPGGEYRCTPAAGTGAWGGYWALSTRGDVAVTEAHVSDGRDWRDSDEFVTWVLPLAKDKGLFDRADLRGVTDYGGDVGIKVRMTRPPTVKAKP